MLCKTTQYGSEGKIQVINIKSKSKSSHKVTKITHKELKELQTTTESNKLPKAKKQRNMTGGRLFCKVF